MKNLIHIVMVILTIDCVISSLLAPASLLIGNIKLFGCTMACLTISVALILLFASVKEHID